VVGKLTLVTSSSQAARSFQKCPLTFSHPDESQVLEGVGPGIIKMLTGKLKEYCEKNGEEMPEKSQSRLVGNVGREADSRNEYVQS
jgi:hypothetical protein